MPRILEICHGALTVRHIEGPNAVVEWTEKGGSRKSRGGKKRGGKADKGT